MINILGFLANLTSLTLWIPQAYTTGKNRKNKEALQGVSYGTQIIAAFNTVFWCIYGLMIHSYWLAMGTVIILPLAIWTIWLKYSVEKDKWYEYNSRTVASPNELIEHEKTGLFEHYMGNMVLCDHQGQQRLKKLDNADEIVNYC